MVCGIPKSQTLSSTHTDTGTPSSDSPVILLSPLSLSMALLSSGFCWILCADFSSLGFLASGTGSLEVFLPFPSPSAYLSDLLPASCYFLACDQPVCKNACIQLLLETQAIALTSGMIQGSGSRSTGIRGGREPAPGFWASSISENGNGPSRREWLPTPVFLPGKSHGQRSLVGYSPWGPKRVRQDLGTKQQ